MKDMLETIWLAGTKIGQLMSRLVLSRQRIGLVVFFVIRLFGRYNGHVVSKELAFEDELLPLYYSIHYFHYSDEGRGLSESMI